MKSRAESFVGNDLKEVRDIKGDIKDLKGDVKSNNRDIKSANDMIQSVSNSATSNIKSLQDKKLNTADFGKTLSNDVNFNKKLNASDFDATLDRNVKFNDKVNIGDFGALLEKNDKFNGKLNTSDFETTLGNSDQLKAKLNTSDFSSTLSKDPAILKLQTDLKGVPTSDNIGAVVSQQVRSQVGDINAANTLLTTNFKDYSNTLNSRAVEINKLYDDRQTNFNNGVAARITEFNENAENKINNYKTNATMMKNDFVQTANTQLDLLNSNYQSKIGELGSLKAGAESARDQAVVAKDAAEEAKFNTQKMYDDVFKEASSRVVTQANSYRNGLNMNQTTGYYESFGTIYEALENPVPQAVFDKEKEVIQDINNFNAKYYTIMTEIANPTSYTDSAKIDIVVGYVTAYYKLIGLNQSDVAAVRNVVVVGSGLPAAIQSQLSTALSNPTTGLKATPGSINELSTMYANLKTETDQTDNIVKKAHEIDELRRDLDTKMDAIMQSKNRTDEPAVTYDSTVYAGILWSVLGTSLLFYVFTE
jgi:hypothetical protein